MNDNFCPIFRTKQKMVSHQNETANNWNFSNFILAQSIDSNISISLLFEIQVDLFPHWNSILLCFEWFSFKRENSWIINDQLHQNVKNTMIIASFFGIFIESSSFWAAICSQENRWISLDFPLFNLSYSFPNNRFIFSNKRKHL